MSEFEKMISGKIYDPSDSYLFKIRKIKLKESINISRKLKRED